MLRSHRFGAMMKSGVSKFSSFPDSVQTLYQRWSNVYVKVE